MSGQRILVLGSGPMMTGQSREYNSVIISACRVLQEAGYTVIYLDSHSASPVSGSEFCDHSYLEPLTREILEKILQVERPHSVLATVSGKTSLNLCLLIHQFYSTSNSRFTFLGTTGNILASTQKPDQFKQIVTSAGAKCPDSIIANTHEKGIEAGRKISYPIIVRAIPEPSGRGALIAYNTEELERAVSVAMMISPIKQIVIEKSYAGSKSTDWVVMRDRRDNISVVGSAEYIEPLGIHTSDSIAVSPVKSLSEQSETICRETAEKIARGFKITGCATIQFAHNKDNDSDITVIRVDPRITRIAMLCGKKAGIPIAEWHTKLCDDVSLQELTSSGLSDTEDDLFSEKKVKKEFCWCRVPVFPGSRLMGKNELLTTYSKSVDCVTGVGINFISALQKAVRASSLPCLGASCSNVESARTWGIEELMSTLSKPMPNRLWHIFRAIQLGVETDELIKVTGIDEWFINALVNLNKFENKCTSLQSKDIISGAAKTKKILKEAKRNGYSNSQLSIILGIEEERIHDCLSEQKILPFAEHLPANNIQESPYIIKHKSRKQKFAGEEPILLLGPCKSNSVIC